MAFQKHLIALDVMLELQILPSSSEQVSLCLVVLYILLFVLLSYAEIQFDSYNVVIFVVGVDGFGVDLKQSWENDKRSLLSV